MAYKLIYVEDLDPGSIMHELKTMGFDVTHHNPETFEKSISEIANGGFDAILIDFRLTSGKAVFDAPTIAQTLRTKNSKNHSFIPIILVSAEDNISDYYNDFSSHDLFDFALSKTKLLKNPEYFKSIAISFIDSYKYISEQQFLLDSILNIPEKIRPALDFRLIEHLNKYAEQQDNFSYSRFVYKEIIMKPGVLIDELILQTRLGISSESKDWPSLRTQIKEFEYTGIFSDAVNLWWSSGLEIWWNDKVPNSNGIRRLTATERVVKLKEISKLNEFIPIEKTKFRKSLNFWTVCRANRTPLDPLDGFELYKYDLYPWQDKQYISLEAALEANPLFAFVKPVEKARFKEIAKNY